MFNFCVKDKYNSAVRNMLNIQVTGFFTRVGILNQHQVKTLINLNLLEKYCLKIPYFFQIGDYFTVLDDVAFDLNEYSRRSSFEVKETLNAHKGKVFRVDRVKGGGVMVFSDEYRPHGFYANWIRHSTEEEIEKHKESNDILNFW